MTPDLALQMMSDLLLTMLLVGAPILGLSMLVGLLVSIVQVVTQIQEMSLTFVPKIITVGVTLLVFGPWMLRTLMHFSTALIAGVPGYF